MKKLIINADDFGVSEDINRGIIQCYKDGVVTDLSILAVGEQFDHAVALAREHDIGRVGVHLALTGRFKAVSPYAQVPTIVDKSGIFPENFPSMLARLVVGKIKKNEIYSEFKEQIKLIKGSGLIISHLDSHEHIHMFPKILKIVLRLMKEEGIDYVRVPSEKVAVGNILREPVSALKSFALGASCAVSKRILRKSSAKSNDWFAGHFHAHRLTRDDFLSMISNIKNGLTEVGCHPGFFGRHIAQKRPWYKHCEQELEVLCDGDFRKTIKQHSIKLVSYADLG